MKIIRDIEQGTQEWHDLRRCKVTGTKLDDVMGTPLARLQLIAELIAEEGTEQSKILRPTPEMERGTAEEIFAIQKYQKKHLKKVEKICMCISDEFEWFGYSPDGLIKEKGKYTEGIEVKNPDSKTVIWNKMVNMIPDLPIAKSKQSFLGIPPDYKWQVVASFMVNKDQQKLHFLIHDARFIDDEAKLYIITVDRNDPLLQEAMKEAHEALISFRKEWLDIKDKVLPSNF